MKNLQNRKIGKSLVRSKIITGVLQNLNIDEQIYEFANKDIQNLFDISPLSLCISQLSSTTASGIKSKHHKKRRVLF